MTTSTRTPLLRALTLAGAALLSAACSQPALIDRTQPNSFAKADLTQGTWYIKESVVDATRTPGAAAVIGYGGKLEKVRFEVQENLLVAYRAYEIAPGADPRVDREQSSVGHIVYRDGQPYRGNPLFAWRIQSHFDRQRQYNAATGEQSNVLEENSSDRPWYEREFMRVDWRANVLTNYDSDCTSPLHNSLGGCLNGRGAYFHYVTEQDQAPHDEAMVQDRNAKGELTYFDWTTQAIQDPRTVHYPGYGDIPYCLFDATRDCESSVIKVRTSVRRVDEAHVADYEPLPYGDLLMTKFGFFRHEAYAYSRDYGYTYSGQQMFAMRHDIWAKSKIFGVDAAGKTTVTTIPVEQRELKPIVYYLSANTPQALWPAAAMRHAKAAGMDENATIEHSWDHAYRRAVAVPRGLEVADVPQMFYLCESPVPEGAPEACGPAGTYARLGDLRYNIVPWVEQNAGGLLGLGPSSMDPETGEVVQAAANVYGLGLDTWAGTSMQAMDVLNGDVSLEDLVAGKDVKGYVFSHLNPTDPRRPLTGAWSSQQGLTSDPTRPLSSFGAVQGKLADLVHQWQMKGSPPQGGDDRRAVVEAMLAQTPALEDELINLPEVRVAVRSLTGNAGFLAKLDSDGAFYRQVARNVLIGRDPLEEARQAEKQAVDPALGCFYEYGYADEDYVGVAKRKKAQYDAAFAGYLAHGSTKCAVALACTTDEARALARGDVFDGLRREAYRSVAEHEIGHTLGLRHNFIGSADALNFQDGYWKLRQETIGVDVAGKRVLPITPGNLADAAKPNQHQLDSGLYEYTYSSIMDYGARVTAQNRGVGKYDDAAILFAYAGGGEPGWVEVFNTLRSDYAQPNIVVPVDNAAKSFHMRGAHVEMPVMMTEHYTPVSKMYSDKYHYTTLPLHFAEQTGDLPSMIDQGITRMADRSFRRWKDLEPQYTKMREVIRDMNLSGTSIVNGSGLHVQPTAFDYATQAMKLFMAKNGGRPMTVEVPYMFCTDSEVGANLLCNRNDQGADVYEMTSKWLERVDQNYVFTNFRRDRLVYSPQNVSLGKYSRYLGNVPNVYQQWLFNVYWYQNGYGFTTDQMDQYFGVGDPMFQNYWTMAVIDSSNHLVQQLAVPSVGYHARTPAGRWEYVGKNDPRNLRLSAADEAAFAAQLKTVGGGGYTDLVYVPRGPGRSPYTVYDTQGYDNFTRVNEAGQFWDFYASMLALITSQTNFLGVDRGSDALRYSLPYYSTFNRELAPAFSAFWMEDFGGVSASLAKLPDGTATVRLPTFINARDYVAGFTWPLAAGALTDDQGHALTTEPVTPATTWSARFYAQLWGMASFTQNFNLEFASFNQVFRLGSGENLSPSPGFDVVTFDDPLGGATYAALKSQTAISVAAAPAMILRGNEWKAKYAQAKATHMPVDGLTAAQWEGKLRDTVRSLEIMRGLYRVFGTAL